MPFTTRAYQFDKHGDFSELSLREVSLREPGPGEALVRMKAIGLNNSEARYVQGRYAPPPYFPTCIGHEGVGEIVALGALDPQKVPPAGCALHVGQRVALLPGRIDVPGMGSYRELGVFGQHALAPVPDSFTDAEAAALYMGVLTAGGAFHAAGFTRETAQNKRVLVTAATSGVGVVALKLARAWGATTIATTRQAAKRDALAKLADHVLVVADPSTLTSSVKDVTQGAGFDVAIDPVGAAYFGALLMAAAPGAQIVSYEMMTGREPTLSLPMMLIKDLGVHGFTLFRLLRNPAITDELVREVGRLGDALRPIVARTFSFSEAPAALEVLSKAEHLGKLVLSVP